MGAITNKSAVDWLNNFDNTTNIERITKKIENFSKTIKFGSIGDDLKSQLESYNGVSFDGLKMTISGDAKTVAETVSQIQTDVIGSREDLQWLNQDLKDIYNSAKKIVDENWDTYNTALEGQILDDKDGLEYYGKLTEAYETYQDAVKDGDETAIANAKENYSKILSDISNSDMSDSFKKFFENMYPDIADIINEWKFEVNVTPKINTNGGGLKDKIESVNGLTTDEILAAFDNNGSGVSKEQWKGITGLNAEAQANGLDLSTFLNQLREAGYLIAQVDKDIDNAIAEAQKRFSKNADALSDEYKKIDEMGLGDYANQIKDGTLQSVFGNVDMDNRQVIDWNIENIEKWKDALSDIKYYDEDGNFIDSYYDQLKESAENGESSIDTVFGDILEDIKGFDGISDIAFSHIVNDKDGNFKFLGQKTAEEYLYGILEIAKQDGDMSIDHILELDKKGIENAEVYNAQGKLTGQAYIHGVISGFNENAEDISKLTHFAGNFGAIKLAQGNDIDWNKYFKDQSIDTQEELDKWKEVTKGCNTATEAMKAWEKATADAGNKATSSLSELEKVSDNIGKLSSAYKELSDNGYITIKTINELQIATGLSGDKWAEYETKLLNAKKGSAEFNQVMSDLTYKIIENQVSVDDLTNATDEEVAAIEKKIAATLRENGVTNASAVAHDYVTKKINEEKAATVAAAMASGQYTGNLKNVANECGMTANAFAALTLKMIKLNNTKLNFYQQIQQIRALRTAMGLASDVNGSSLGIKRKQGTVGEGYSYNGKWYNDWNEAYEQALADETDKIFGAVEDYDVKPVYADTSTKSSGSDKSDKNDALDDYLEQAERRF